MCRVAGSCYAREGDEAEVRRVEHQLDRHQDHDQLRRGDDADDADREQDRREDRITCLRDHGSSAAQSSLRLASTHGADHGREQEQRDDLEGQHVVAEERRARARDCRRSRGAAIAGGPAGARSSATAPARRRAAPPGEARAARRRAPDRELRLERRVEVEQHDDEQEQHHDRAGVDDDLDRRRPRCASSSEVDHRERDIVPTRHIAAATVLRGAAPPSAEAPRAPRTSRTGRPEFRHGAHASSDPLRERSRRRSRTCSASASGSMTFQHRSISWS